MLRLPLALSRFVSRNQILCEATLKHSCVCEWATLLRFADSWPSVANVAKNCVILSPLCHFFRSEIAECTSSCAATTLQDLDWRVLSAILKFCAQLQLKNETASSVIFVKSQQWPTPSESIAIYCVRKLVFVYYTSSVLRRYSTSPYSTISTSLLFRNGFYILMTFSKHNGSHMDAHRIWFHSGSPVQVFFQLGPRALCMLQAPRHHIPALPTCAQNCQV